MSLDRIRVRRAAVLGGMLRLLTYMCIGLALPLSLLACGGDDGEEASGQTVDVSATEYSFDPSDIQVDAAGKYTFHLTNAGNEEHALELEGQGIEEGTDIIGGGDSAGTGSDTTEGETTSEDDTSTDDEMGY